ncbi:hypothetical protein L7F22_038439 [Adiantum nelumboides]|nr:hypothetical protein [Adiantum nelumboides]
MPYEEQMVDELDFNLANAYPEPDSISESERKVIDEAGEIRRLNPVKMETDEAKVEEPFTSTSTSSTSLKGVSKIGDMTIIDIDGLNQEQIWKVFEFIYNSTHYGVQYKELAQRQAITMLTAGFQGILRYWWDDLNEESKVLILQGGILENFDNVITLFFDAIVMQYIGSQQKIKDKYREAFFRALQSSTATSNEGLPQSSESPFLEDFADVFSPSLWWGSQAQILFAALNREPYTSYIREAIRERYALLPYFYTLFREANTTGTPVMRPLWMEFPEEEMTFAMDKECMVGNSLLIHGVYTEGATSESVYLPSQGPWYELKTGTAFLGGDYVKIPVTMNAIPVFQRGGTIIPRRERPRRSSSQTLNDPYTLVVALDDMLEAEGELYIDDGKSFDFAAGAYIHRKFTFSKGRLTSSNIKAKNDGKKFTSSCLIERIVLLGVRAKDLSGVKHAVVQPHNRRVELEVGPLVLREGPQSNAYIIRKPNVLVSEDWSIKVL